MIRITVFKCKGLSKYTNGTHLSWNNYTGMELYEKVSDFWKNSLKQSEILYIKIRKDAGPIFNLYTFEALKGNCKNDYIINMEIKISCNNQYEWI